jgi:hypothetical protein
MAHGREPADGGAAGGARPAAFSWVVLGGVLVTAVFGASVVARTCTASIDDVLTRPGAAVEGPVVVVVAAAWLALAAAVVAAGVGAAGRRRSLAGALAHPAVAAALAGLTLLAVAGLSVERANRCGERAAAPPAAPRESAAERERRRYAAWERAVDPVNDRLRVVLARHRRNLSALRRGTPAWSAAADDAASIHARLGSTLDAVDGLPAGVRELRAINRDLAAGVLAMRRAYARYVDGLESQDGGRLRAGDRHWRAGMRMLRRAGRASVRLERRIAA